MVCPTEDSVFKKIDAAGNETPSLLAEQIRQAWSGHKVVHVSRPFDGSPDDLRSFYDGVLEALGEPAEIGEDATAGDRSNQRTGQRWMEIRYDPDIPDAYRHSANAQPLHTDGSYIPDFPDAAFIYCQANVGDGGETVFVDSAVLIDALKTEAPELLGRLTNIPMPHSRSGDQRIAKVIENVDGDPSLHWNYYCVAEQLDSDAVQLRQDFHEFLLNSATIRSNLTAVALRPGDCVVWKDYKTLHGRNGFEPSARSERFLWKSAVAVDTGVGV